MDLHVSIASHLRDIQTLLLNDKSGMKILRQKALQIFESQELDPVSQLFRSTALQGLLHQLICRLVSLGAGIGKDFFDHVIFAHNLLKRDMGLDVATVDRLFRCLSHALTWHISNSHYSSTRRVVYIRDWKRFLFVCKCCVIEIW